jgi:RimJ/RimL family protein N-acetyltransferase
VRPVELHTGRLLLDEPRWADADLVTRYCQDPLFERYLTTPWPYTRADADEFLGRFVPESWATGAELTWAIRRNAGGPLLGVISVRAATCELGFWLGAEHRGVGIMREAASAVCEWVFAGGIPRAAAVHWRAVEGNLASARVARAAGFRRIRPAEPTVPTRDGGTLPAWHALRGPVVEHDAASSWDDVLAPSR